MAAAGRMAERLGSPFGKAIKKILHGCLKPHNLLLDDRQTSSLKIADFGLAQTFNGAPAEYSYEVFGTFAYKAAELILEMRQTTAAADIWPVGCIFAEMVNGTPPFGTKTDVPCVMRNIISILGEPTEIERPGATSALREFCANGALHHPYFKTLLQNTQLLNVFYTPRLSFEWMDKDTSKLIEFGPISTSPVKVLHRDLKPHNLLLDDRQTSSLKIADFGLAQTFNGAPAEYSYEVVGTLAYKAAELIIEMRQTIAAADIWPVGSIFTEMVNGSPFYTKIDVYRLMRNIISILGVVTETEWPLSVTPQSVWMDKDIAQTFDGAPDEYSHEVGTLAYIAPELILGMQQTTIAAHIYVMRGLIISVVLTESEVALGEFCAPNKTLLAAFPKYADGFSCLESDLISKVICSVSGESIFSSWSSAASILQSLAEATHILFKKLQIVFHGHSRYFASRSGKRGRRGSKPGKSKKGGGGGPKQKSKEKKAKVGRFMCYDCQKSGRDKHLFNSAKALTDHKKDCPSVR